MNETGFNIMLNRIIVVYVGRTGGSDSIPLSQNPLKYNIGDRLMVTKVTVSTTTGITYYAVTDGRTLGAWYDAKLFKRLDDIRAEKLDDIGI
jgi:hypothetical protein